MENCQLSIITPFHNLPADVFRRTATSVMPQLRENWEWIIVLHNTETVSPDEITGITGRDSRVRIFEKHDSSHSPCSPRNFGLKKAGGKYVYFLDDDDELKQGFLAAAVEKMEKEDIDILIGRVECIMEDDRLFSVPVSLEFPAAEDGYLVPDDPEIMGNLLRGAPVMLSAKVIRRKIITENGIEFDEEIMLTEDVLFMLECSAKARKICVLQNMLAYSYIQSSGSLLQRMMKENSFPDEVYLRPVRKITEIALKNGISPGAYLWVMLGLLAAVYEGGKMEEARKRSLMSAMQPYLPLITPSQMKRVGNYVTKRTLDIEEKLTGETARARVETLKETCPAAFTAADGAGFCDVPVYFRDISGYSGELQKTFLKGFWNVLDGAPGKLAVAAFPAGENRSVLLIRMNGIYENGDIAAILSALRGRQNNR